MKLKKLFVALAVLLVCQLRVYAWYDTYVSIDNLGYLLDKETKEAAPTSTGSSIPADATVLVIPESVEYEGVTYRVTAILGIGDLFVRGYSQIKSLYIPSSITYVAKGAFQEGCTLEEIHITDLSAWCRIDFQGSPLWYTRRLFLDEEEIVDLVIPDDVTSIPAQAFRRLKNLRSVIFPEGLESIGDFAFQFCESLTAINLPKSLKHIGGDAFHGCYDVEYINILGDVVSMGECAFSNCRNLSTIIIKGDLGDLTNDQFLQLYNLKDIYCYAETPPTINSTTFDATPVENVTFHVPQTAIETYKENTYWNSFGNIVALLPEEMTNEAKYVLAPEPENETSILYDLSGRRLQQKPSKGIYIQGGRVMIQR